MSKRYKSVWDAIERDPHVAQHLKLRSELLITLQEHLRSLNKTQKEIADMLGVHQPRVSQLFNGKVEEFSLDRLVDHASHAGLWVALEAKTAPKAKVTHFLYHAVAKAKPAGTTRAKAAQPAFRRASKSKLAHA